MTFMPRMERPPWWRRLLWKLRILKRPTIPPFTRFEIPVIKSVPRWPRMVEQMTADEVAIVLEKGGVSGIPAKLREEIGEDELERLNRR